jgi:uncharacterized transporter YbjL
MQLHLDTPRLPLLGLGLVLLLVVVGLAAGPVEFLTGLLSGTALLALSIAAIAVVTAPLLVPLVALAALGGVAAWWVRHGRRRAGAFGPGRVVASH